MQFALYDGHEPIRQQAKCYGLDLKCPMYLNTCFPADDYILERFMEPLRHVALLAEISHQGQTLKIVFTSGSHAISPLAVSYHSLTSHRAPQPQTGVSATVLSFLPQ